MNPLDVLTAVVGIALLCGLAWLAIASVVTEFATERLVAESEAGRTAFEDGPPRGREQ